MMGGNLISYPDLTLFYTAVGDLGTRLGVIIKFELSGYRKIPKISPEAYIFQRPFLRGLFLEGLLFGGAYVRGKIYVSKSIGLAL